MSQGFNHFDENGNAVMRCAWSSTCSGDYGSEKDF